MNEDKDEIQALSFMICQKYDRSCCVTVKE